MDALLDPGVDYVRPYREFIPVVLAMGFETAASLFLVRAYAPLTYLPLALFLLNGVLAAGALLMSMLVLLPGHIG